MGTVFPDPRPVAAIVDRVTFNAYILDTGTNSYRLSTTTKKTVRADADPQADRAEQMNRRHAGTLGFMHQTDGVRDAAASFPLSTVVDDRDERRRANRAVAVSAAGLALTGLIELAIAVFSGLVALLGDALHNLSDVSTSLVVFQGFRLSRKSASELQLSAKALPARSGSNVKPVSTVWSKAG